MTDKIEPATDQGHCRLGGPAFHQRLDQDRPFEQPQQSRPPFRREGYRSIFDYWRGDVAIVAEPAEFSGVTLPPDHYYTGPLIARRILPSRKKSAATSR